MSTIAAARPKPRFDNGPLIKSAIAFAGTAMTIAISVAIFKFLAGLAPDDGRYRNIAIAIHVVTVLPCVPLGAYLLLSTKGTRLHKALGKLWVTLMVVTAIAITFVRGGTDFSWIHIFVPLTLAGSWKVISTARAGKLAEHRKQITTMYLGALMIPGIFAFLPDRLMGMWLFG